VQNYPHNDGVTFTGGEPFCQPEEFARLAENLKNTDIWCFTGYTFEELQAMQTPAVRVLLERIDVLVDGRFIEAQFNHELKFKGSKNQRFINCKESLKREEVVLLENN
jgi:anaerobic ribonucleoside-triphosphate reductase activating protein